MSCSVYFVCRNYPLLMAAWKVAPALAAGCTAILKPSELASVYVFNWFYIVLCPSLWSFSYLPGTGFSLFSTCLELADICREVGLPPGVLNVVTGLGREAGASLASHPLVDKVSVSIYVVSTQQN